MKKIPGQKALLIAHGVTIEVLPTHLLVTHEIEKKKMGLQINFAPSKTHFGNCRYWLRCPNQACGRRCGKLYLHYQPDGMPIFVCRKCSKLVYASQNKSSLDRMIDKKWVIVHKLGGSENIHLKPKWMHKKTFDRMTKELETLNEAITWVGFAKYGR
jgi:hypothetical protein